MNLLTNGPEQEALLARVRAGAKEAVEFFAAAVGELARRFFYRSGLSKEDAEDLAQECVMVVIKSLGQFNGDNFGGWMHRVMLHMLFDHARAKKRRIQTLPLLECDGEIAESEAAHNGVLTAEQQQALKETLGKLTPEELELIHAQTGDERVPHKVMAQQLGLKTAAAARVRYHRARKKLQKLKIILEADPRMQSWLARH